MIDHTVCVGFPFQKTDPWTGFIAPLVVLLPYPEGYLAYCESYKAAPEK